MSFSHTISSILRGKWMIEPQWANAHLPLVLSILKGPIPTDTVERNGNEGNEKAFVIDPSTMERYELMAFDERSYRYVDNPNIPENSVGIIPISGAITKYNTYCGPPGMISRNADIMKMGKRKNISSVVMMIDTPGGEVGAQTDSVKIMRSMGKPVLSYVDGMTASLGVWFSSASDEVYFGDKTNELGSIGSYCRLIDFRGWLEKEGYKLIEIYAPQSVDKNKDYRDALNGDTSLIEKDLEMHVNEFISYVKQRRPAAAATVKEWGSGKMFYADDAVKLGLADGIKSFAQVVSKAAWLAKRNK